MVKPLTTRQARGVFRKRLILGVVIGEVRAFCKDCDRYIPSSMPWICGHCTETNQRTRTYSFLNRCEFCKRAPKAIECPHCAIPNFLGTKEVTTNGARKAKGVVLEPTKDELRAKKKEARDDAKEDIRHEIEMARLNADLEKAKDSDDGGNIEKKLAKDFDRHMGKVMGIHNVADAKRKELGDNFKDDPNRLDQWESGTESWKEKHS